MARCWLAVFVLILLVKLTGVAQSNYDPEGSKFIETGKFQEALDRLVQATSASPEDAKVYATLSLLYTKIGECSLAWKYLQVAEDLRYRNSELQQGVKSLCKKPKEERREETLKVDRSERATLLTIQFSPEQQQWPARAKLPIFHPSEDRTYCELTIDQVRKLRKLLGRTVPWLVIAGNQEFTLRIVNPDGWWTVLTQIH